MCIFISYVNKQYKGKEKGKQRLERPQIKKIQRKRKGETETGETTN
jgi:hypothetical protein